MRDTKVNIAKAIKELGYNSRQVSIKSDSCSYRITVRDPKVNIEKVEAAVKPLESVSYDERTQEILSGGNTFIFVYASEEVKEAWANQYLPMLELVADKVEKDKGLRIDEDYVLFGTGYEGQFGLSYFGPNGYGTKIGADRMSLKSTAINMHMHKQGLEMVGTRGSLIEVSAR